MNLATLYPQLTPKQKQRICEKVPMSKAYLSELAHHKKQPKITVLARLVAVERRLSMRDLIKEFGG